MTKKIGLISGLLLVGVALAACQPQQEPALMKDTAPAIDNTVPEVQYEEQFDTDPPMATPTPAVETLPDDGATPISTPMTGTEQ